MTTLQTDETTGTKRAARGARIKLLAILAVCAAPVIASYLTYYVIRPEGRTNYGTLVEPQRQVGELRLTGLDAKPRALSDLAGHWVLLTVDSADCDKACDEKLYAMRQVRLTTGKDRERLERVLLLTGAGDPDPRIATEYEGMVVARIDADAASKFFPSEPGTVVADHIYVVDPIGNLMMRFPKSVDPNRMKKDVFKLLRASRVG